MNIPSFEQFKAFIADKLPDTEPPTDKEISAALTREIAIGNIKDPTHELVEKTLQNLIAIRRSNRNPDKPVPKLQELIRNAKNGPKPNGSHLRIQHHPHKIIKS